MVVSLRIKKSDYVGHYFFPWFYGSTKIRLNLQMDKNFKKFQHSASASVFGQTTNVAVIQPSALAECKN